MLLPKILLLKLNNQIRLISQQLSLCFFLRLYFVLMRWTIKLVSIRLYQSLIRIVTLAMFQEFKKKQIGLSDLVLWHVSRVKQIGFIWLFAVMCDETLFCISSQMLLTIPTFSSVCAHSAITVHHSSTCGLHICTNCIIWLALKVNIDNLWWHWHKWMDTELKCCSVSLGLLWTRSMFEPIYPFFPWYPSHKNTTLH